MIGGRTDVSEGRGQKGNRLMRLSRALAAGPSLAASAVLALSLGFSAHTRARADCVMARFAELPVTLSAGRALVPVSLDGHAVMLAADSGAFFSILNPEAASALGLPLSAAPAGLRIGGVGGASQSKLTTIKSFSFAGLTIPNVNFFVAAGAGGDGAAGILGENVLGLADADYDLSGGAIRLIRPQGCGDRPLAYWAGETTADVVDILPEGLPSKKVEAWAYLNGKRIKVLFDSGSWVSSLTLSAARRVGVQTTGPGVVVAGFSEGIGAKTHPNWIAPVDSFKIGGEEIKHTRLRLADLDGSDIDMLLGADFFLSHRIYVSATQRKIYFTYNGRPVFDLTPLNFSASPGPPAPRSEGANQ